MKINAILCYTTYINVKSTNRKLSLNMQEGIRLFYQKYNIDVAE
jgi:hypothetical protein